MSDLDDLASIVRHRPVGATLPRPCGAGIRVGAVLVDVLLLFFLGVFVGLAIGLANMLLPRLNEMFVFGAVWTILVGYAATEVFLRGTPGKWLLGISITGPDGDRPRAGRLVARWAIKNSPLLLTGFSILFVAVGSEVLDRADAGPRAWALFEGVLAALGWVQLVAVSVVLIGTLGAFFPARRALHDWLTGTAVMSELELTRRRGKAVPRAFEVRPAGAESRVASPPPAPFAIDDAAPPDERVPAEQPEGNPARP